jgi:hypothetical protein
MLSKAFRDPHIAKPHNRQPDTSTVLACPTDIVGYYNAEAVEVCHSNNNEAEQVRGAITSLQHASKTHSVASMIGD